MLLVLCFAVMGGRLVSRRIVKQKLGADDYWAITALFLFVGLAVEQFCLAHYGTGTGVPSAARFMILGKLEFASQLTYTILTTAAKLSILFLYRRVFNLRTPWFRIAWWSCLTLVSLYAVTLFTLNLTQCAPHKPSTLWEHRGECPFEKTSATAMGFLNAFVDLTVLILPIRMTWDLQMSQKQKIAISSVFGLGLMYVSPPFPDHPPQTPKPALIFFSSGVAVSLARAITLSSPSLFTRGLLTFAIWSTVEPAVALICACLPVMRPLFISILKVIPSSRLGSWPRSWTRSSSSRSGPKPRMGSPSAGSEKTLTNNSTGGGGSEGRGMGKAGAFGGVGKGLRADSFNMQGYSKVETTIEAKEVERPSPPPPTYSLPIMKRFNSRGHLGNFARPTARDKGDITAMHGSQRPGWVAKREARSDDSSQSKEAVGSKATMVGRGDEEAKTKNKSMHFCSRCEGEIRGGWD